MLEEKTARYYLSRKFKEAEEVIREEYRAAVFDSAEKIVELIIKQDLSYEEAYASLECVNRMLEYRSNFPKVQ